MNNISLVFDKGTICVNGDVRIPHGVWDERIGGFRTQALHYREIIDYLKQSNLMFEDKVEDLIPCSYLSSKIRLRKYQKESLDSWNKAGKLGVIVLPTGAGKTIVAIKAIELVNEPTIVVVPTLDLIEQWKKILEDKFGIEVGIYGGGDATIKELTVSTYDSAYLRSSEIGNRFRLIIFDEVHHLPAEGYRQIAETFTAPYRMGLTATFEREDMLHKDLPRLTGGIVFKLRPDDLAGRHLADYTLDRITVELTESERLAYQSHFKIYTTFISRNRIKLSTPAGFQKFIMRTGWDKEARKALLARNKALDIAFNSESKIKALENILISNPNERILIFTQHNHLVYRVSKRFLIPYITHTTGKEERTENLELFRNGKFRILVTSKVLDEGIDVPEASLGIVLSGTGSSREFIQRLGRLLRKKGKKRARLIEIVSSATAETKTSIRRKREVLEN